MNLLSDIRFALRLLIKNPGSSAMAILVMAVGTGVAITMFAFLNGVLWSSLELKENRELFHMQWTEGEKNRNRKGICPLDFEVMRNESETFEYLVGFAGLGGSYYNPSGNALTTEYRNKGVSHDFFKAIGETMLLGRTFRPEDVSRSVDDTMILSHKVWQEQFGGNEDAIGSILMRDGEPYTVVGIARPGFEFPADTEVWIATGWRRANEAGRGSSWKLNALGILRDGVSLSQGRAELETIAGRLAQEYPETNDNLLELDISSYTSWYAGNWLENISYALFVCSLLVLGIACSNVFNIISTRTAKRTSELSIRGALGASRKHIVFQVLLDGLFLTAMGALGGVLMAGWGLKLIWIQFQRGWNVPYWWHMEMDGRVLGFVVGLVLVSAVASSLIPGLRASRSAAAENLKDDSRTSSGLFVGALSRMILSFQITATGVLVFVSIMMVIVWHYDHSRESPVDGSKVVSGLFNFPGENEEIISMVKLLEERLEAYPGVQKVMVSTGVGGLYSRIHRPIEFEGVVYEENEARPTARMIVVSEGFDDFYGVEPLVGRSFRPTDTATSELVWLVNKSFADYYWPNENPIGKRIRTDGFGRAGPDFRTIVGVMPDLLPKPLPGENIEEGHYLQIYMPMAQGTIGFLDLNLRTEGEPHQLIDAMQREYQKIAPQRGFKSIITLEDYIKKENAEKNVIFAVFGVFGAASLVLGMVGLYAVMSFSTRQRFREFGIRMALGADSKEIIASVVKRTLLLLTMAGVLGISLGHVVSIVLRERLEFGDLPLGSVYPAVVLVLLLSAALSIGVPAWRASRISPTQALRVD